MDKDRNMSSSSFNDKIIPEDPLVKVNISILKEDYDQLLEIATEDGLTLSTYLKKALATKAYINKKRNDGAIFLIEKRGWQREIMFK